MGQRAAGTILGHPKGLAVLFFTEMWERFSYYGMRALLVLYMVNYFKWTQADASKVYKWYTSLVYLTPLLGGFLADRYLGNRRAVIIGGTLMAIGHFLMASERLPIFYAALIFLILGNGFFKPNMSTQVGRLYPANDARKDSAYTIFYMGINLGAFFSPHVCGWFANNKNYGYHWGFGAAGVGMVIGLLIYLFGAPWVVELDEHGEPIRDKSKPAGARSSAKKPTQSSASGAASKSSTREGEQDYIDEKAAETTPSALPIASEFVVKSMPLVSLAFLVLGVTGLIWKYIDFDNAVAWIMGSACVMVCYFIGRSVRMAVRDRVLAIFALCAFSIFFWAAFEQAGNTMNVIADKSTNRYFWKDAPTPSVFPEAQKAESGEAVAGAVKTPIPGAEEGYITGIKQAVINYFNPISAESYQSVNPFFIITIAPLFAWLWLWLQRRKIQVSIAAKMATGLFLQGIAAVLMLFAYQGENKPTTTTLGALPGRFTLVEGQQVRFKYVPDLSEKPADLDVYIETASLGAGKAGKKLDVVHGGRLTFDASSHSLKILGALSDNDRDHLLRASVPDEFLRAAHSLGNASEKAAKDNPVRVNLEALPPGFDLRYSGFSEKQIRYAVDQRELETTVALADREYKMLLLAGANPELRDALNKLYVESAQYKMNPWWIVVFYFICTLGELCLSPVGLSMVSKLAPARFATMLMGMWLLTSFFGGYVAGLGGEYWGSVHPYMFFIVLSAIVLGASIACYFLARPITRLMHGIN